MVINDFKQDLLNIGNPERVGIVTKYFQAFKGGYGEGDVFIGARVPDVRFVAKKYQNLLDLVDLNVLIKDDIHEVRLGTLFVLSHKYEKTNDFYLKKKVVDFYLNNLIYINNWDLVDSSAYKILGHFVYTNEKINLLTPLLKSNHLWSNRVAVVSCFYAIKNKTFDYPMSVFELMLKHEHHLMHKAIGWMLREIGKRNEKQMMFFVANNFEIIPKQTIRYAIEQLNLEKRKLISKFGKAGVLEILGAL